MKICATQKYKLDFVLAMQQEGVSGFTIKQSDVFLTDVK
jgi:hypothetical protein